MNREKELTKTLMMISNKKKLKQTWFLQKYFSTLSEYMLHCISVVRFIAKNAITNLKIFNLKGINSVMCNKSLLPAVL